ncbi:unnamed protein product [Dimorphilus gyrociliatus]|uniref:Uncharacterized protein n=1 Tax=Dimorphilus gyrociliatus TaxID=2664684 RepID=A0A7I8VJ52_9ANNE|nr:unnamed protein product [Dimorphilus gyrociliatus]
MDGNEKTADNTRKSIVRINEQEINVKEESINGEEKEDEENEIEDDFKGIDPYQRAMEYLSKNDIFELFQSLTAGLVLSRPQKSIQYMINEIDKIRQAKEAKNGSLVPDQMDPYKDPPEHKATIQEMFTSINVDNK